MSQSLARNAVLRGLLASVFATAGIGAASAQPSEDVTATLTLFRPANESDIQLVDAAIVRFNERYPNVTVEVLRANTNPWGEYINNFINLVASGRAPDIVNMPTEGVSTIASQGLMRNLDELIEADPDAAGLLADIDANLIDGTRYEGNLYFFPSEWNTSVTYYNIEMFEAAGLEPPAADWTWDDFLETARALTITEDDGTISQYGFFVPGLPFVLMPWFYSNDTMPLTPDGLESNVQDPRFRESLEFLHSLIFEHRVAPTFANFDVGQNAFAADQVAMFQAGHWVVPTLLESEVPAGVQYVPANLSQESVYGVQGAGITNASEQPELAWEFIKELSGLEFQEGLAANMRSIPTRRSVATSDFYVAYPENAVIYYESTATNRLLVAPPSFAQIDEILIRHVDAYLTGNQDIDTTIDGLHTELTRALSR